MKKYLLLGFLSSLTLNAVTTPTTSVTVAQSSIQGDKELVWVDEQIQAILPSRVGVSEHFINTLCDPMKMKKSPPVITNGSKFLAPPKIGSTLGVITPPKIIEEPLHLLAIMNKSVLINGKWYKVGESIRNFTLSEIKPNSVLLSGKKDQKLILFLTKPNNNIKIITK